MMKTMKRFGSLLAVSILGTLGAMAQSTNALEEIESIATSTSSAVITATIVGLSIFAALFIVRKLRSAISAGAGR